MKRSKGLGRIFLWLFLVLIIGVGSAYAAPANAARARKIVRGWLLADGSPLQARLGSAIAKVDTFADEMGESLYHIVYLNPSGFVIVAADDEVEPIIGFASEGTYDSSESNPLGALVNKDLRGRIAEIRSKGSEDSKNGKSSKDGKDSKDGKEWSAQSLQSLQSLSHRAARQAKWRSFDSLAEADGPLPKAGVGVVSDIRVAPFVQSKWSQTTANNQVNGQACYNYYTPPGLPGTASNYPCGCVATAMVQLMRYYQHPTVGIGVKSFTIQVNGVDQIKSTRGGDGVGGPYNWSQMMLIPNSTTTVAQREAIGALCYDAGVAVKMMYASGASGAYTSDSRTALVNTFSYSNAVYSGYSSSGILLATLYKMVNPNLDAGYPVMLGIDGNAGHAILADGYGYNASTLYHHLNMGWAGASDAWYNLPIINTDVGYYFNVVDECVYNVYPSGTGEIISGRVTTPAGIPLAGLTITAERTGGGTYTATTTSQGIYALPKIPANSTYTIHVAGSNYRFASRTANTTTSTNATVNCGNYWGADFQGRHPADFNGDNVVDGADISFLLSCFTGPEGSVTNNCQATDLNNDSVVDMEDFAILQRCLAPTPELLDPDCVDEWR